jgi:hypothetical protein
MTKRTRLFLALSPFTLAGIAAAFIACGPNEDQLPPPPPPPPPPPSSLVATPPPDTSAATSSAPVAAKPPALPVALGPGAKSPDPDKPTPTVKITAPAKDQVVAADKAGEFVVKLDVKNWQTAQGSSHVHLILDNRPYKAIYDPKAPVTLNELTGGEAIAEGQHVLVAFPSRANHESVKTKDALFVTQFFVGKKGETPVDLKKPLLIYSRPKGEYKGAMASHIIIDFQIANTELGADKNHVNVTVTGPGIDSDLKSKVTDFGTPLYLDNAQNGSYTIKEELVDKDDKLVAGPWNSTTRTISVDKDAISDTTMGHSMGDMDGGAPMAADAGKVPPPAAKDAGAAKKK